MGEQMKLQRLAAACTEAKAPCKARERIAGLLDEGTFVETDGFALCGVITGYGEVLGAPAFVFSQDVSQNGGAITQAQAEKIQKLYTLAVHNGAPVVGIYDSHGADLSQGVTVLESYSAILASAASISGVVPQVSLVLGVCAGVSAMAALTADFVVMSEEGKLFITPPSISTDTENYGSAKSAIASGTASIVEATEADAIAATKKLVAMLPQNNLSAAATFDSSDPVDTAALSAAVADIDSVCVCDLVKSLADQGSVLTLGKGFGRGICTALATFSGYTVGVVATKGSLDRNAAARIAKLVSICDSFQIPVLTILNTDGVKPSGADELSGAVRDMARVGAIYAEATTPKIALYAKAAVGAAAVALGNADLRLAWPGAYVSALSPAAAVAFLKSDVINAGTSREAAEAAYIDGEASVFEAAKTGYISDIIAPESTRATVIKALDMLSGKRVQKLPKKHPNLPL